MFQSPCGELVMKGVMMLPMTAGSIVLAFQSPCGELVMKAYKEGDEFVFMDMFQSPCGELVMKVIDCLAKNPSKHRFSPLAGNWL